MQGAMISYGLLAGLAIALIYVAFTDIRRRQIDNWLNAGIALAAPLYWWACGLPLADIGWQIGLALAAFGLAALLFYIGQMGGGDVKLIAALALWFPPIDFLKLTMMMALLGYILSVAPAIPNMDRAGMSRPRLAFTYACGGAGVLISIYAVYMLSGGPALSFGLFDDAANSLLGNPWLYLATLIGGLTVVGLGMLPIVRRQRSRLATPYGVAIAGGGLWLLASDYLLAAPAPIISG